MSSIIRRLVKEVNKKEDDSSVEEDIPIEHLELAEIARKRVLIKSTFKSHIIIYLLTNTLLILINLNVFEPPIIPIDDIVDFWAAWPILIWGIGLIAHATIVITINIIDYDKRVFVITTVMNIAIGGLLVYINYLTNYLIDINTNWWIYVFTFLGFFIIVHAWLVFRDSDKSKLEKKIRKEYEKLKELEEKKNLEEEKAKKEILGSNYSINN